MSATTTFHVVCDSCGKREDVTPEYPNGRDVPLGWSRGDWRGVWGDFCSEPCLRQVLVQRAINDAAKAFVVKPLDATPAIEATQ